MARYDERAALTAESAGPVRLTHDHAASNDRLDLTNLEKLPARDVAVRSLVPGVYLRQGGTNAVHVQLLLDVAGQADLPPILVQEDGWRVIDGLHRLEAAKIRGDQTIKARFLDCTDSEALVLAIKSNTSHGLPLSKADRVAGAKRVLSAHPDWSDRAIAGITGLSAKTIASLRNRSGDKAQLASKRLGRDGKRRPVAAGEGRRRAAEYISAHPDAPLRQVARETDVSLGTVHDVSARLRHGINPELTGRKPAAERLAIRPAAAAPHAMAAAAAAGLSPAGANGTPLRRKRHNETPLTWTGMASKVANDPAIRYTERGKEFLRWMALHATHVDGWREFIDAIPVHWLSVLAPIADDISEEWSMFAERLRSRQEAAS